VNDLPSYAPMKALEQILMNLCSTRATAMPNGGAVEMSIDASLWITRGEIKSEARAGQFVCLSVTDHGSGMTAADSVSIFDHFLPPKRWVKERPRTLDHSRIAAARRLDRSGQ